MRSVHNPSQNVRDVSQLTVHRYRSMLSVLNLAFLKCDWACDDAVATIVQEVKKVGDSIGMHAKVEELVIAAAMEEKIPGSSKDWVHEHREHESELTHVMAKLEEVR